MLEQAIFRARRASCWPLFAFGYVSIAACSSNDSTSATPPGSSGTSPRGGSPPAEAGSKSSVAGADAGGASSGGSLTGGATFGGAPNGRGSGPGTVEAGTGGASDGQTVIKVTTLAATGAGSLSAALAATGPRLIVFEVGGVIDLNRVRLDVTQPFVKIAGQTAPSPGITLIRGGMRISTHDVVIQHIRFRMGDAGAEASSGFEPDVTSDGANAYNIVFDHVSVAWGVDENLSVSGPRMNGVEGTSRAVTIQNSIIAEGLKNSVHQKGAHSMGTLVHDYCTDVLVANNLYAHNDERNPWYKGFATGAIVNNVIYNPGRWAIRLGPVDSEWSSSGIAPEGPRVSIVGNYMKTGVDTPAGTAMIGTNSRGSAYMQDNVAVDASGAPVTVAQPAIQVLSERPAWRDGLVARPASAVVDWVLTHSGARPKDRDPVDARIVADFRAGTGTIIDSQDEVGGYPMPASTERALTVPANGIEAWLATFTAQVE